MKDKLIKFETAKLARKKGFNEECQKEYNSNGAVVDCHYASVTNNDIDVYGVCTAPTQTTLQTWLREQKKIVVLVNLLYNEEDDPYFFNVFYDNKSYFGDVREREPDFGDYFKSYEEALEIGLKLGLSLIK